MMPITGTIKKGWNIQSYNVLDNMVDFEVRMILKPSEIGLTPRLSLIQ